MTTVTVPATVEEAVDRLRKLDRLLMAKGWERAAILATFIRLPGSGSHNKRLNRGSPVLSAEQFAADGIPGLRDPNTIRLYVQRWLDANGGRYPTPGDTIELPAGPWPPTTPEVDARTQKVADAEAIAAQAEADGTGTSKALDIAKNTKAMAAAIKASPPVAQAAVGALIAGGLGQLDMIDAVRLRGAIEDVLPHAVPKERKAPSRHHWTDVVDDDYWKHIHDAFAALMDLQHKISAGDIDEIPGGIALMMQILMPRTDWDEAAAELLDGLK